MAARSKTLASAAENLRILHLPRISCCHGIIFRNIENVCTHSATAKPTKKWDFLLLLDGYLFLHQTGSTIRYADPKVHYIEETRTITKIPAVTILLMPKICQ
jgi:hypothetical protein